MKLLPIAAAWFCLAGAASAGNYANEVLAIGAGARALGMGGAFVGLADDSTAVYWNPAGLTRLSRLEVGATQQGHQYGGLNEVGAGYFFLSGAIPIPDMGTFGAAIMHFGVGDIPQVSGVNGSGEPIEVGRFTSQDYAALAGWGMQAFPALAGGLTVKYLGGGTSGLVAGSGVNGDATYHYVGLDLGLLADFGGAFTGLSLGLNIQDLLNTGVSWQNTPTNPNDRVSLNPKIGLAYQPVLGFLRQTGSRMAFAADLDPKYGSNSLFHLGAEYWYHEILALRLGFRQFAGGLQSMEPTFGASFRIFMMQVDYAYINYELTPTHYLSLSARFGGSTEGAGRHEAGASPSTPLDPVLPKLSLQIGENSKVPGDPGKVYVPVDFNISSDRDDPNRAWRLEVLAADGFVFRSYRGEVTHNATVNWEGKDATGEDFWSNSDYSFRLSLTDKSGKKVLWQGPKLVRRCVFRR